MLVTATYTDADSASNSHGLLSSTWARGCLVQYAGRAYATTSSCRRPMPVLAQPPCVGDIACPRSQSIWPHLQASVMMSWTWPSRRKLRRMTTEQPTCWSLLSNFLRSGRQVGASPVGDCTGAERRSKGCPPHPTSHDSAPQPSGLKLSDCSFFSSCSNSRCDNAYLLGCCHPLNVQWLLVIHAVCMQATQRLLTRS